MITVSFNMRLMEAICPSFMNLLGLCRIL